MKKSIKSLVLSIITVGMLAACNEKPASNEPTSNNPGVSELVSSSNPNSSSEIIVPSSSSSSASSSSSVPKTDIIVNATKTEADLNERILLSSNVQGVTYTTTQGATIEGDVFYATQEGTYVVTGHKDGDFNDGTIIIRASFRKTAAKVKNIINNLKTNKNYTLKYTTPHMGWNKLYRTPTYAFRELEAEGQALLNNNLTSISGDKVAHFIRVNNNKLVLGSAVIYYDSTTGDGEVAKNLDEIDAFYDLDLSKMTFTEADGKIYCADRVMKYSIASMLNSIDVMFGDEIEFDFDENNNLTARVMFYDPDTGEIVESGTNYFGYLTFLNVGTTCAPVVDDALKNLTISNSTMSESIASSFMSTKGHLKTTIKFETDTRYAELGTSEYHFDEKYLKEDVDSNSEIIHNFYEKIGDDAYRVGIKYDNTIKRIDTAYWSSFTFPYAKFDISDFRKVGEHTYSYFGDDCANLANDLAWASVGDDKIAFMNATESNGKITSIYCETRSKLFNVGTDTKPIYEFGRYTYDIEVIPYETLVAPAPFEADANTSTLNGYFNEINKADANYTITITDGAATGSYKKVKVTSDTIFIEQYANSTQKTTYRGYHRLPDGVIEFGVIGSGNSARLKLVKDIDLNGKSLASLLGFKIAPEVLTANNSGQFVFKDGVLGGGEGLFNEFKYSDYAYDETVQFTASNGHLTGIDYVWYDASNAWEKAVISDYGTTALNSDFEAKILSALANIRTQKNPTNWQEEDETVYSAILEFVGQDVIQYIPYIYNAAFSGNFTTTYAESATPTLKISAGGVEFGEDYRKALIDQAVAKGMVRSGDYKADKTFDNGYKLTVYAFGTYLAVMYRIAS